MTRDDSTAAPLGPPYPESYWAATARTSSAYPKLGHDLETDVAIIGAGFTGLSAAYHLNRLGRACVVLEANRVGWGASGRNGGMVVPRYKHTFPALAAKYGANVAVMMHALVHRAVDTVENIVADCGIECGFSRCGHITPVVSAAAAVRFEADVDWLAQHAQDRAPTMLDRAETARRIGTTFYSAGYFEPRGAGIQPLDYCLGLASALYSRGVRIYCDSPVADWTHDGSAVVLHAHGARVRARHLIIATNGYTDLTRAGATLERRVVPMVSSVIVTERLPEAVLAYVLPQGNLATDAKRLTNYFRVLPEGRLFFGGRGGASNRVTPGVYLRLARDLAAIFPKLDDVPVSFRWSGRVAVTLDGLPHLGAIGKSVSYALGYNGRGVALSALLGGMLARVACGDAVDLGPMNHGRFGSIPFHGLRVPAKQVAIAYYKLLDAIGTY